MKFSQTLVFNAVPEWREHYIDYGDLKRLVYQLERTNLPSGLARSGEETIETSQLIGKDPELVFTEALDREVQKVDDFFRRKEQGICATYDTLIHDVAEYEQNPTAAVTPIELDMGSNEITDQSNINRGGSNSRNSLPSALELAASDSSDEELGMVRTRSREQHANRRRSSIHRESAHLHPISFARVTLRRRLVSSYVQLNELLSYADLNRTGVRKALKKFDKTLGTHLLPEYTAQTLRDTYAFADDTATRLGNCIDKVADAYSEIACDGDLTKALEELKKSLREHVVYERDTVWRELIGMDGAQPRSEVVVAAAARKSAARRLNVCGVSLWIPGRFVSTGAAKLCAILAVFLTFLWIPVLPDEPGQSRCFAIVAAASLLWATEALPLFVTSLAIPVAVVVLRVPVSPDGSEMTPHQASEFVFAKMWSPVITVLLGGFTLAAALSKYGIAKAMATAVLSRSGSDSPRIICLVLMMLAMFMCMWISNVAAPVLLYSVAQPLLRTLPPGDTFAKALILGIALASNVGGMSSPIASPQNILALQNMDPEPSWVEWFFVSIPVSLLSVILVWVMLMATYPPSETARSNVAHLRSTSHHASVEFTAKHWFVIGTSVITIALWCVSHQLEGVAGDMGVLALFPIVVLFGSGVLSSADFNNFLWTVVALAMGGIVLGKSVESCGLLATAAKAIQSSVDGMSVFGICLIFGLMILVVASFISHTVAALIVLPLIKTIGDELPGSHSRLLVMLSALMCSAAMALPTSGFPNVTAICLTDELGTPYLTVSDFLTRGVPASFLAYLVVVTVGYVLGSMIGF